MTRSDSDIQGGAIEIRSTSELREHPSAGLVPEIGVEDYRSLRADIERRGLQEPLEITAGNVVLNGHLRLRAARELGLGSVPVRVVAPADEVEYLLLAALQHRHLSPSQRAALVVELDRYRQEQDEGRQRRLQNLRQNTEVAKLPPRGKTRDLAASRAGVSPRIVQSATTVRKYDPDLFARVKAGKLAVDVAERRIRRRLRDEALPAPPPLSGGLAEVILADPAWQLGAPDGRYAPENHYPTMPLEEIKAMSVPAAEDSVLFLWAVASKLPEALEVMRAWGFEYKTCLVWVKDWIGLGTWVRHRHELLLLGRRGNYPPPDPEDRPDSVFEVPRGVHSEKPTCVYELIERAYPLASKLELFARGTPRSGWTAWGNEVETG
ncbi:MAG: MT-A70 family methyltransferase [Gaiellaceae bacterium]|jgi:N6-adenosine-specific RNA methylase IME4